MQRASIEKKIVSALMRLPTPLLAQLPLRAADDKATDGQWLDPQLRLAIFLAERTGRKPFNEGTPAEARTTYAETKKLFAGEPREMRSIASVDANGVPGRLYRPITAPPSNAPLVVYYHGGGGVIGDLDTHDVPCRILADCSGALVLAVDYRLAPENKFPKGLEDAISAYLWVNENVVSLGANRERIAVAGDSMGGNLAAVLCQQAVDQDWPMPCLQLLIYPWLDPSASWPSRQTFGSGYLLTTELLDWFVRLYLADDGQRRDPRCAPYHRQDVSRLPPAIIATAGFDPLRDEGRAYADRLESAGVATKYLCYSDLIHGFISFTGAVDRARIATEEIATHLGRALS